MTPYAVFFFSSGGVEENWTPRDIPVMRANVLIGFPLGGLLSLSIAGTAWLTLGPAMAKETFGERGWGYALSAESVGLLLTTAVMMRRRLERPLPLPESISRPVLRGGGPLPAGAHAAPMDRA